jgi:hypothetical protein
MKTERKTPAPVKAPVERLVMSFDTFRRPSIYQVSNMTQDRPSCFNGNVEIKRYRVTFEEIEEPIEVLRDRVKELWRHCDNSHHWEPLKTVARGLGIELDFKDMVHS